MFWRRKRRAADYREEIRAHLQLEADELKSEGLSETEAGPAARKAFGNVTRTEERLAERGRSLWFEDLLRDVRYGAGTMRRNPGFTLAAVLTLTLGIGVNTTIFSFVNALLLRPLPVPDSGRLISIYTSDYSGPLYGGSSYPDYLDFHNVSEIFSGVVAYSMRAMNLSTADATERVQGHVVTGNYFQVLGVEPVRGRSPAAADQDGIVVSYGLWQRAFAADPQIVGRRIVLNGNPYHVAGVAPRGFTGLVRGIPADLWVPLQALPESATADWRTGRSSRWLAVAGRLADGVDLANAQAAFRVVAGRLHAAYPQAWTDLAKQGRRITLRPANDALSIDRDGVVRFLTVLMAVVGIVLMLACVNIANLLLARALARTKELSIRLSLGAGRSRLIRQLLTESLLLSFAAGVAGIFVAIWATGALMRFRPPLPFSVELDLTLDARVLGFAAVVSLATALLFGLLPALRATRPDLTAALKDAAPESAGHGARLLSLRNALTVAQVALSLLLLVGAGLFIRNLMAASAIDVGFARRNVVIASMDLGRQGYDQTRGAAFYRQMLERVEALPGVRSASLAAIVPLGFGGQRTWVELEGYTPRQGEDMELNFNVVSPRYFETMGIALIQGREFTDRDAAGSDGAVVVNEALARRYWPGENPLGKRLRRGRVEYSVVGVARDGKYRSLSEEPLPYFYFPLLQYHRSAMSVHVRTHGPPAAMVNAIRAEVRALDKDLPLTDVKTLEEHLGYALLPSRVAAILLGSFGALALVLAIVGIYGVVSYAVSRRTREVGIRMALGAKMSDVVGMVLRQSMLVVAVGLVVGAGAAAGLTRFTSSFLYGVSPTDPWTFAGVILLLAAAGLAASLAPALRAARILPTDALRCE